MKKIVIIALLALGIASIEAKGTTAGAFTGSFFGSTMGTAISRGGSGSGNCDNIEALIEKYEDENDALRTQNSHLVNQIQPHRGLLPELESDFESLIDDFDEDL